MPFYHRYCSSFSLEVALGHIAISMIIRINRAGPVCDGTELCYSFIMAVTFGMLAGQQMCPSSWGTTGARLTFLGVLQGGKSHELTLYQAQ